MTYIEGKISDPRATNPTSTMPKQDRGKEQVAALVTFLKAQQGANIAKAPLSKFRAAEEERPKWLPLSHIVGIEAPQMEAKSGAPRGEALLPKVGCLSCRRLVPHQVLKFRQEREALRCRVPPCIRGKDLHRPVPRPPGLVASPRPLVEESSAQQRLRPCILEYTLL